MYPVKIKQDLYTPLILNIQVAYNSDFISSSSELPLAFNDCDDSNIHSLVIDGDKIITVNEPSQFDSKIGIQFSDIRMLKDGSVIGYIDITMVIGDVETNEFGASVLDLEIIQPMNTLFKKFKIFQLINNYAFIIANFDKSQVSVVVDFISFDLRFLFRKNNCKKVTIRVSIFKILIIFTKFILPLN